MKKYIIFSFIFSLIFISENCYSQISEFYCNGRWIQKSYVDKKCKDFDVSINPILNICFNDSIKFHFANEISIDKKIKISKKNIQKNYILIKSFSSEYDLYKVKEIKSKFGLKLQILEFAKGLNLNCFSKKYINSIKNYQFYLILNKNKVVLEISNKRTKHDFLFKKELKNEIRLVI